MSSWVLYWDDGTSETINGTTIETAIERASKPTYRLYYYEEAKTPSYEFCSLPYNFPEFGATSRLVRIVK